MINPSDKRVKFINFTRFFYTKRTSFDKKKAG